MVEHLRPQLNVPLPSAAVEFQRVEPQGERGVDVAGVALEAGAAIVVSLGAAVARGRSALQARRRVGQPPRG